MDADPVGEGGKARRYLSWAADDGGGSFAEIEIRQMPAHVLARLCHRARKGEPEPVENRLLAERNHVRRDVLDVGAADEFRYIAGQMVV